jgi:hypothetical protein
VAPTRVADVLIQPLLETRVIDEYIHHGYHSGMGNTNIKRCGTWTYTYIGNSHIIVVPAVKLEDVTLVVPQAIDVKEPQLHYTIVFLG